MDVGQEWITAFWDIHVDGCRFNVTTDNIGQRNRLYAVLGPTTAAGTLDDNLEMCWRQDPILMALFANLGNGRGAQTGSKKDEIRPTEWTKRHASNLTIAAVPPDVNGTRGRIQLGPSKNRALPNVGPVENVRWRR
jgi:hypothetical protein